MITVGEPFAIVAGGCACTKSPTRAAGAPQIRTVGAPGGRMVPGTGTEGGIAIPGVVASPTRAAGYAASAGAFKNEIPATVQASTSSGIAVPIVRRAGLN